MYRVVFYLKNGCVVESECLNYEYSGHEIMSSIEIAIARNEVIKCSNVIVKAEDIALVEVKKDEHSEVEQ